MLLFRSLEGFIVTMGRRMAVIVAGVAAALATGQAAAQQRSVDLVVPAEVSDADAQRIAQSVNRFFKIPQLNIGGQVTTPLGSGGIVVNIGRSASPQSRSVDMSQFANRSIDDYERDIFKDIACNAAAAAAAAACPGSGPALAACLAVVEAARQACMR
jgi:hypothetical protein